MQKRAIIPLIIITVQISSCSLFQARINEDYKRDDLAPAVIDSMGYFILDAYKMNPQYTNDFIIASIRQNALNVRNTRIYAQTLINILGKRNSAFIDENYILSHLDSEQKKTYHREYPSGLPSKQSIEEIVQNNPYFENSITCEGEEIDSHWAYFSATGDTKVIDKIESSLHVYNMQCCFDCLRHTLIDRAALNKDVYEKLIQIRDKYCASVKNTDKCINNYNNWYIPPVSQCEWRNPGL